MYNEQIILIAESQTVNEYGDIVTTTTEKPVFAKRVSVGGAEFYQAAAVGLRPEVKFVIADALDYSGERLLSWQPFNSNAPLVYTVIRTYQKGNALEITCRRGVGDEE